MTRRSYGAWLLNDQLAVVFFSRSLVICLSEAVHCHSTSSSSTIKSNVRVLFDVPGNLSDDLTDKCGALAEVTLAARNARLALGGGGLVALVQALKTC